MGAATCDFAQSVKIIHRAVCMRARERNDRRPFTFKDAAAAPADSLIDNARSQRPLLLSSAFIFSGAPTIISRDYCRRGVRVNDRRLHTKVTRSVSHDRNLKAIVTAAVAALLCYIKCTRATNASVAKKHLRREEPAAAAAMRLQIFYIITCMRKLEWHVQPAPCDG
jgi:hypothetical protein